jgi:DNA-directed RNA polymerase subunit M/transcription elongation factor TFIIS
MSSKGSYSDHESINDELGNNVRHEYVCDEPCGSILDYTIDKKTKALMRKCTTCQTKYPVPPEEYIISSKAYFQAGEENSNEPLNFNRIIDNNTIMTVYFNCPTCKKKSKAKHWRSDQTMMANYLCISCKELHHAGTPV